MDEAWQPATTAPAWLDDPYNAPYNHHHPFQRCGLYPWVVFGNTVDTNVVTTLETIAAIKWQPVGFDSEQADDSLTGSNSGSRKAVMDLDGDGLFDGFNVGMVDGVAPSWLSAIIAKSPQKIGFDLNGRMYRVSGVWNLATMSSGGPCLSEYRTLVEEPARYVSLFAG